MPESVSIPWSPPRWLRRWPAGTLALLFALLTLGAVVTSFRIGMADPVWPTRPWHLLTISWQEPSPGFLIEHLHRLAGFTVGAAVAVLAIGLWWTEPRPALRRSGVAALVALLAAFGQLHGTLIAHQKVVTATGELTAPNWAIALGPTLIALALVAILTVWAGVSGSAGRGLRVLGIVLLVAVMAQGILGGLRVYLNALLGTDLAAVHGVFSQVVLALAVAVVVFSAPRRDVPADDRWHPDRAAVRWGVIAAAVVFTQIVAGAVLRHTSSPLGPRLHLLVAFLVVSATAAASRRVGRDAPRGVRRLATLAAALAGVQVVLGVEAWMMRFNAGFVAAAWQPVTAADAITRTAHALVGYCLFATAVALALTLLRARETTPRPMTERRPAAELESVA
jgi:heme a synthase